MILKKRLLPVLPVLASVSLFAAACGGSAETTSTGAVGVADLTSETNTTSAANSAVEEETAEEDTVAEDTAADETVAAEESAADESAAEPSETRAEGVEQTTEVLALAIESVQDTSYSFEQGLNMELDILGESLIIGTDEPFITGQVDDGESALNADIGSFMLSMFESMGLSSDDAIFGNVLEGFASLEMDVWTTEDRVVMDLSDFAETFGALDPAAAAEFEVFADGPVSIDLSRLAELGVDSDIAAGDLASQFGGAQVVDPADFVSALSSIDELEAAGVDSVNGVAVDVYIADVSFVEYSEALGQEGIGDLGSLDALGLGEFDAAAFTDSFEDLEVDFEIMVDADGLVRQIGTTIDMSSFFSDLVALEDDPTFSGDMTMIVETWQTFDNYGQDFDISAPEARDVTSELAGLIDS